MAVNGFFFVSVEQRSMSRDHLYPELEGLLCSEEEVCLTQGALRKWAEWVGGKQIFDLSWRDGPSWVVLLISSSWRNIAARKDDPTVHQGPNKCTRHWDKLLAVVVSQQNCLLPAFVTLFWSPISNLSVFYKKCITAQVSHKIKTGS